MDIYFYNRLWNRIFTLKGITAMHEISLRITGFIGSILLTLASYFIILNPTLFNLNNKSAAIAIFIFALIQSILQLICFINVWKEEEGTFWNLSVFISTVSIIFIIIYFSIWIINHLNYNMH